MFKKFSDNSAYKSAGGTALKFASPLLLTAYILGASPLMAQDAMNHDMHQHHDHAAMEATAVKNSEAAYRIPSLAQIRQDGKKVSFPSEIDDGRPVILQFIYTSCTAVCPVTTQMFAQAQTLLDAKKSKYHMLSISIDPEYDTPTRLSDFSRKLGAGAQWDFYTGTLDASIAMQKAMESYRGDKMNHVPITFLRAAPGKPWLRMDGLRSPEDIVKEFKQLLAKL